MNSKQTFARQNIGYLAAGVLAALFMLFIVMPFAPGVQKSVVHGVLGMKAFIAHADGEGGDGANGGDGGGGANNGGSADANGAGGAVGGDCACGGPSTDTGGGNNDTAGGGDNATPAQPVNLPAMIGSISVTASDCVANVPTRQATVTWQTQNAQQTVAQAAGGQYGGGQNLVAPGPNASGSLTLTLPPGAYLFGVAGYNGSSWTTLQNVEFYVIPNNCTPPPAQNCPSGTTGTYPNCVAPVTPAWTYYCTGGDDINGNFWQWWQKTTNTNPIQYQFVRAGDGACTPPAAPTCPSGTTGTYPNCSTPTQTCQPGYTMQNGVCTPPVQNCPAGYTQVGNTCVPPTQNCPAGYTMQNNICVPPNQAPATTTPIVINNQNNNQNNNTNNNTNNNNVTVTVPSSNPQVVYLPSQQPYYPPNYYQPYQPPYNNNQYPTCALTVSPTSITPGQAATLSWSSNYATRGWISDVGSVNQNGSVQVSPTLSTTYTATFIGQNGQTVTCSTNLAVQSYIYPVTTTPYVTLSAVPYTGFELGPIGQVAYWSLFALMGLLGVYLVAVRRVHQSVATYTAQLLRRRGNLSAR